MYTRQCIFTRNRIDLRLGVLCWVCQRHIYPQKYRIFIIIEVVKKRLFLKTRERNNNLLENYTIHVPRIIQLCSCYLNVFNCTE